MGTDLWTLTRRSQLLEVAKGTRLSISAPLVGPKTLAVAADLELRLLLGRGDLVPRWKGVVKAARPVGWYGDDLHLVDEDWRFIAWDSKRFAQKWAADGADRGYAVSRDELLLMPAPGLLQTRDARNGQVLSNCTVQESAHSFQVIGDCCVLFLDEDQLGGFSLSERTSRWHVTVRETLQGLAPTERPLATAVPVGDRGSLLCWRTAMAVLDIETGGFRWAREIAVDAEPLISQGRVAMLGAGHLFICDEATGETITDVPGATATIWESAPVAHGGWMVVVDEQGYIVTVALSDGRVVGVQKEKGTGFSGCVSVDGRLLVGGLDGALWVYEPTQESRTGAQERNPAGSSGKSHASRGALPSRGSGGARRSARARVAPKAKPR